MTSDSKTEQKDLRELMGTIIHEFCHIAVFETFGSPIPFYKDQPLRNKEMNDLHEKKRKEWEAIVDNYKSRVWNDFSLINNVFSSKNYPNEMFIKELVVRYPQFHVQFDTNDSKLQQFEIAIPELSKIYSEFVEKEFIAQIAYTKSLRYVNGRSYLGDKSSKLKDDPFEQGVSLNLSNFRQVVKTNQTFMAMSKIHNMYKDFENFKSTFMFIDIDFLDINENFKLVEKALTCEKVTYLFIDGFSDSYQICKEKLESLFQKARYCGIILILHESQGEFEVGDRILHADWKLFQASELKENFKNDTFVNFQGDNRQLSSLIGIDKIDKFYELVLVSGKKIGNNSNSEVVQIGDSNIEVLGDYVERTFKERKKNTWKNINLNEKSFLELFKNNSCIYLENESGEGKTTEVSKMFKRLKIAFPDYWVVCVNLSSHTDSLKVTKIRKNLL